MLDRKTALQIVRKYGNAWVRRDTKEILRIFAKNGVYHEYVLKKPFVGHSEIREYWEGRIRSNQRNIHFKPMKIYIERNTIVAECDAGFDDVKRGIRIRMKLLLLLKIKEGKIANLREYWSSEHLLNNEVIDKDYKRARVDHIMINANHYQKGLRFYTWLLQRLGYSKDFVYKKDKVVGWVGSDNSIWLMESDLKLQSESFDKRRVGLRELSFSVPNNYEVDRIAKEIEIYGGKILDKPKKYPQYSKGYYSTFFTDPDGLKLEVVSKEHKLY